MLFLITKLYFRYSGYRNGHGPIWKCYADKAMKAFPELPIIARCHSYTIRTKYQYRCVNCGYTIGRHSKSLDTATKRCGYCRGEFQLHESIEKHEAGKEYRGRNDNRGEYETPKKSNPYVFICSNPQELLVKFPMQGQHKICKSLVMHNGGPLIFLISLDQK